VIAEGVVVLRLAQHQLIGGVVHAGVLVQVDDQSHIRGIFRLGECALVERRLNGGPDCGVGRRRRSVADETVADSGTPRENSDSSRTVALIWGNHAKGLIPQTYDSLKDRWWAHQDLNLGQTDYESAALTN
jgi:hypothetical protein